MLLVTFLDVHSNILYTFKFGLSNQYILTSPEDIAKKCIHRGLSALLLANKNMKLVMIRNTKACG